MPGSLFWAYFVGVAFFAAAAGILCKLMARPAATMLGVMFFLFVVLLHIPRIVGNAGNGNEWTSGFVALAMCGGAWILANAAPLEEREKADPFLKLGRYFFALAFVAFGIQHFVYAHFGAGLGPPFFTGRPLRAYLTGVVLVAIGTAIILGKKARIAATLLGTILFVPVLLIHAPRLAPESLPPGWSGTCHRGACSWDSTRECIGCECRVRHARRCCARRRHFPGSMPTRPTQRRFARALCGRAWLPSCSPGRADQWCRSPYLSSGFRESFFPGNCGWHCLRRR